VNQHAYQDLGQPIRERRADLASGAVARLYHRRPELENSYTSGAHEKCVEDVEHHLRYLAEAVTAARPGLFEDYARWAATTIASYGVNPSDLLESFEALRDELRIALPDSCRDIAARYVQTAIDIMAQAEDDSQCSIDPDDPFGALTLAYLETLLGGDRASAVQLILDRADGGASIPDIYLRTLWPAQIELGRRWQRNELGVAQEHFCTAVTQMVMSQLAPRIFATPRRGLTAIATCVTDDPHEIGVRMVADLLEHAGWDVFYLGANTPIDDIIAETINRRAALVAVSATMTYHLRHVATLIAALRDNPETSSACILVGGRPFNREPGFWADIGADATAPDAGAAVDVAESLISGDTP